MAEKKFEIFNYHKDQGCFFYEPVSTHEDADPYLDQELSVVCDGSGGAGGFYHTIETKKMNSYEKIKDLVLPEDKEDNLQEYIEKLFMKFLKCEEDTITVTSAYIASRIVLPRFVYAYKTLGKEKMDKITDFIVSGMKNFANTLKLQESDASDKVLLPTTFVAIAIDKENKSTVEFDVYWAGDSRAYYLNEKGLKQLSIDDEDASGAINNLFCLKKNKKPVIRHRHYVMNKPCFLFTCSDGYFDVFTDHDNLSVDFATSYWLAFSNTMEEVAQNLARFYNPRVSDDTTFSLMSFGFKDMAEIKEKMMPHVLADNELLKKKNAMADEIKLIANPGMYQDIVRRLHVRTKDMLPDILKALAEAYSKGIDDAFVKGPMKKDVIPPSKIISKKDAFETFKEYLLNNYYSIDMKNVFDASKLKEEEKKQLEVVLDLIKDVGPYILKNLTFQDECDRYDVVLYDYYLAYFAIEEAKLKAKEMNPVKFSQTVCLIGKFRREVEKNINNQFYDIVAPKNKKVIDDYYKEKKILDDLDKERMALNAKMKAEGKSEAKLKKEMLAFFALGTKLLDCVKKDAKDEILLSIIDSTKPEKERRPINIMEALKRAYNPEGGYKKIIEGRLELENVTTVIDHFYNKNQFTNALKYTVILKKGENKEAEQFEKEFRKFEADVLSEIRK